MDILDKYSDNDYFTISEICKLFKVSRVVVMKKIKLGKLNAHNINGRYIIYKNDAIDFMASYRLEKIRKMNVMYSKDEGLKFLEKMISEKEKMIDSINSYDKYRHYV